MQVDYAPFTERMIHRYEGGYGWSRADTGGPTKYGITCFDLAEHRGQKMDSMARWAPIVAEMTLAEAEQIYATKYATYIAFDQLNPGPDVVCMDYAVNSGNGRSALVARQIAGTRGGSARLNAVDVAAINKIDPKKFVDDMCGERLRFMHAIRGGSAWAEFGHGWQSRMNDLVVYGDHLAIGGAHATAPAAPDLTKIVQPKAINTPKTAGKPTIVVAGGAGSASVAAGHPHWVSAAIVGGIFVAGVLYEAWEDYKATAANNTVHLPAAA